MKYSGPKETNELFRFKNQRTGLNSFWYVIIKGGI
jgi:hypothetical protein